MITVNPAVAAIPLSQLALDLLKQWGVNFNVADPNSTSGGGFWKPEDKTVNLNTAQTEAALHETSHAWWDYVAKDKPDVKAAFVEAVKKLANDTNPQVARAAQLAHDYVYGDTFPGMMHAAADGGVNDWEMYAGLASGVMGDINKLPTYIQPYYSQLFDGGQTVAPQTQQVKSTKLSRVAGATQTAVPQQAVPQVAQPPASAAPSTDNSFTYPLHTEGKNVVDATGKVVRLASTALGYGGGIPFGIWWQGHSIGGVLDSIKASGFNSIRLPLNMQTFAQPNYQMNLGNLAVNHPDLAKQGVQPVQVLDYFLGECQKRGIGVILDMHGFGDGDYKPSIWYTHVDGANGPSQTNIVGLNDPNNVWTDSVNEQNYIQWWQAMAKRYGNNPAVIGADLLNEPHDKVTWGDGNPNTDWRGAAERIGGAIQQIAPNWLIVVEGMDADVNRGGTIGDAWWGGNLSGVAKAPVRLPNVVYSPHDYGPSVWGNWWLSDPAATRELWEREWGYIARNNIAPIWIGEFGQPNLNADNGGGQLVRQMLDYTNEIGASWSYWIWDDGASSDTGGLMPGGDGKPLTPFPEKMQVLQPYMNITQGWGDGTMKSSLNGYTPSNLTFKDEGRPGFPPAPYAGYVPVTPTLSTTSTMAPNATTASQPIDPDPVHQAQKAAEAAKLAASQPPPTVSIPNTVAPTPTPSMQPLPVGTVVPPKTFQPQSTDFTGGQWTPTSGGAMKIANAPTPTSSTWTLKRVAGMKPLSQMIQPVQPNVNWGEGLISKPDGTQGIGAVAVPQPQPIPLATGQPLGGPIPLASPQTNPPIVPLPNAAPQSAPQINDFIQNILKGP
jgi:endoglucanase